MGNETKKYTHTQPYTHMQTIQLDKRQRQSHEPH